MMAISKVVLSKQFFLQYQILVCLFITIDILLWLKCFSTSRSVVDELYLQDGQAPPASISSLDPQRETLTWPSNGALCFHRRTKLLHHHITENILPCFPADVNYSNYSGRVSTPYSMDPLDGLLTVEESQIGIYATFDTFAISVAPMQELKSLSHYFNNDLSSAFPVHERAKLRVVVQASGYLRTFQECAESLRTNILRVNEAKLFLVTYPTTGNKRFNVFSTENNDTELTRGDFEYLVYHYRPYLAGIFLLDMASVHDYVRDSFPHSFPDKSRVFWTFYQLFTTQLVNDIATASVKTNKKDTGSLLLRFPFERMLYTKGHNYARNVAHEPFDIAIRVRPDLYVMGPLWVTPLLTAVQKEKAVSEWRRAALTKRSMGESDIVKRSFAVYFVCNQNSYPPLVVPPRHVVRAPYHPLYSSTISDLSGIVSMHDDDEDADRMSGNFFRAFFGSLAFVTHSRNPMLYVNASSESMWDRHTEQHNYTDIRSVAWHFLLRRKSVYYNSSLKLASRRVRKIFTLMLGATDAKKVRCPK